MAVVDVLLITSLLMLPAPPGRPSIVTYCAPLKSRVAVGLLVLMFKLLTTPEAGRMVNVLTGLKHGLEEKAIGYVSLVPR